MPNTSGEQVRCAGEGATRKEHGMSETPRTTTDDDERENAGRDAAEGGRTADGGPGSHTDDQTGGEANDPASGGISEEAAEDGA